ncbi:Cinnamoyl-CoA reductase [Cucumis melo var. makuwa]|uniref:Cinnamoyl-CoA reductase n=2 Tax=Cucumis melo TaxID=3656 RepID=A0A5A7TE41_CUCMM|nr:Cinnamoyl-CoA reductase [Cucumis melo var. makuwa]
MSELAAKTVCVTGGSGYIASWIVKFLLQRGYTVRASVRDPDDPIKAAHLVALDGADERLHLFKANLLEEGSFDSAIEGCQGVFHTASPFFHSVSDPQAELIEPALKGTLNVLNSVAKASSVKRVVLTSSMAAVSYNTKPQTPQTIVDESWFSDPDMCRDQEIWYSLSKTLAEEAAWNFVKEKGIDLVTINPAMVIGPLLQPTLNTSAQAILNLISGGETFPNSAFGWVNVKDVANAHIEAYEIPTANGRYCLVERALHYSEMVKILHQLYPSIQLPQKAADEKLFVLAYQVSTEKAKSLGIDFIPLEDSLKETVESLKEKNFIRRSKKMSGEAAKTVCVTGGSGYIASWIVKFLLQRGYIVKASVRNPADPIKTAHLLSLDGAAERLHLFKANLLEEGSFDSAIEGCQGVFHTASPFFHNVSDPQAELIDPALKGTLNVLKSVAKSSSVKRVVLTSSMAAVAYNGQPRNPDTVIDETWFSNPEICKELKLWYVLSKTLAEEAAWNFVREKGIDMVTINPAMVIGPLLQPTLNTSAEAILNLISGAQTFPNSTFGWVNVKDVANAHILAYEVPSANGRYCLVESVIHYSGIVKILHDLYPSLQLPDKCADDKPFTPVYQVSVEKAKNLGIQFIPLVESLKETVESLKEKNFINF